MKYGMFAMPLRPPGGDVTKNYHRDVETFVLGDRLGYSEGWMGGHFTIPWEPIPASDLFVATVIAQTEQIRMGPGVVLLPMHDPRLVARLFAEWVGLSCAAPWQRLGSVNGSPASCASSGGILVPISRAAASCPRSTTRYMPSLPPRSSTTGQRPASRPESSVPNGTPNNS